MIPAQKTFFIYDLETSGFNPREARVMQFAGIRTDLELNPIEEPHNYLIKMTDDVLPDPDAVLITGITPQKTITEGYAEAEFLKIFYEQIATADTVFMGYNTIRFDDEFMRFLNYRNFYDAYEWQYKDNRSKWDLLDVARMMRALRPDGIKWPVDSKGVPTNRLELLTKTNSLLHDNAHDALSDVRAVIALAQLIRSKQPKLFDYLFSMREKQKVAALVNAGQPFVYSSGKYASEFEKTTVVGQLAELPNGQGSLVFDLRYDSTPFLKLDAAALAEAWRRRKDDPGPRLPVKTVKYNRCPAIAPLNVLDKASQERLKLSPAGYQSNFKKLLKSRQELAKKVLVAAEALEEKYQTKLLDDEREVDSRLYDDFFSGADKTKMNEIRSAGPEKLNELNLKFKDARLDNLLPLYKARNYPGSLTGEDREVWERYRERKLISGGTNSRLARYLARIGELQSQPKLSPEQNYLLEELKLYAESIIPAEV
jgi:exodeoxyribonuclease-1